MLDFIVAELIHPDKGGKIGVKAGKCLSTPSRWGTQAPFSNITLDWTVPADLAGQPCIVGGKPMSFTYGDCQPEMDMINKAFIEVMIEGDANGRGFQYPIPTYSITKDFDWSETENNRLLFFRSSRRSRRRRQHMLRTSLGSMSELM